MSFEKRVDQVISQVLNDSSLSRLYQHIVDENTSFTIITSWRASNNNKKNRNNFNRLIQQVKSASGGPTQLTGHWRECQDPSVPYDKCPPEELIDVSEPSLFVQGLTKAFATQLANEYDKDAFIFSEGPDAPVLLILRDGSEIDLGKFHPQKIAQGYSKIKGKTFVFEEKVTGWAANMVKMARSRLLFEEPHVKITGSTPPGLEFLDGNHLDLGFENISDMALRARLSNAVRWDNGVSFPGTSYGVSYDDVSRQFMFTMLKDGMVPLPDDWRDNIKVVDDHDNIIFIGPRMIEKEKREKERREKEEKQHEISRQSSAQ